MKAPPRITIEGHVATGVWLSSSHARSQSGSRARDRPITRSRSVTTKTSCCAGWIRDTAASGSFSGRNRHALGLDFYIRPPESIPNSRLATLARPTLVARLVGFPFRLSLAVLNPRSNIVLALAGSMLAHDEQRIYARNFEVPSGGGVGTARAIARAYSVFATGGQEIKLRPETLHALTPPAVPPTRGFYDECMMAAGVQFSLGFMKHNPVWPFGNEGSFGFPGAGGSLGFADPKAGIGYAYVTNQMGTSLTGDPRDIALRNALYARIPPAA